MIDYQPTEDQQLMREAVAQWAKAALGPRVREIEGARAVPEDLRRAAVEMGLPTAALPDAVGGQGLGLRTAVLLEEELGRADAGAAFGLPGPAAFGWAVTELGTAAQAKELLAPFADGADRFGAVAWSEPKPCRERAGFTTVAEKSGDGWTLRGEKAFVLNAGLADRFVVMAQVDPAAGWNGLGAFVVERGAKGLTVGARCDTLGLDAAFIGALSFDGVAAQRLEGTADAAAFTRALLRFFCKQGLIVAARAVGLSQSAFDLARVYCDTRIAFGKPIGHFQAVAFTLADRLMDVESARWLVWEAAWSWDADQPERDSFRRSAQAIAHTLETAMRCGDDCVSLHGGAGFVRDVLAEKYMRDAKQIALACPSAEQLDQLATAVELGAPLEPALVLPTPDAQAIAV